MWMLRIYKQQVFFAIRMIKELGFQKPLTRILTASSIHDIRLQEKIETGVYASEMASDESSGMQSVNRLKASLVSLIELPVWAGL